MQSCAQAAQALSVTRDRRSPASTIRYVAVAAFASLLVAVAWSAAALAQTEPLRGAGEFTVPAWFRNSFLDLRDDAGEAGAAGRRLLVYIGQNGCPYCAALFNANFSQKAIVDYTRDHFDAIEINMWGDRPVTDFDGEALTEKTFAAKHEVAFTPTILFFDGRGTKLLRIDGYYPPRRFSAALRYVVERGAEGETFAAYLARVAPDATPRPLRDEEFFDRRSYDLRQRAPGPPIVVFFEQRDCDMCEELHRDALAQRQTRDQLARFRAIQLDRWSSTPLTTPDGRPATARAWADELGVAYLPAIVFFDRGHEVMRIEAMLKAFHLQSVMDYVASGAYRSQPSFQRFIQARAERLRGRGIAVDLWK